MDTLIDVDLQENVPTYGQAEKLDMLHIRVC